MIILENPDQVISLEQALAEEVVGEKELAVIVPNLHLVPDADIIRLGLEAYIEEGRVLSTDEAPKKKK